MFSDWASPQAVFEKLKLLTVGQPCEITGIRDYQMLDDRVVSSGRSPRMILIVRQSRRSSGDSLKMASTYHESERAIFNFEDLRKQPESPTASFLSRF